jgi:energy-coupling factor transporter ATP-binding protein EcfA2
MIRRLYAHNFRSLENFEMTFTPGQPTVLMGANGSGKSSVRLALEFIRDCFEGKATGIYFTDEDEESAMFEADFFINGVDYAYQVAISKDQSGQLASSGHRIGKLSDEQLVIDGLAVYVRSGLTIKSSAGEITLGEEFVSKSSLRFEPRIKSVLEFFERSYSLNPVPILIGLFDADYVNYSDASWLFVKAKAFLGESARNAVGLLSTLQSMIVGLEDFVPSSESVIFKRPKRLASISAKDLSDGEKILFLAAYLISTAKAGRSDFLFWDEPECFLAKSELQSVTMKLVDAYKDGQLILCTHDAGVADVFDPEHVLWFYRDQGTGPTRYKKLSELPAGGPLSTRLARGDLDPE